LLYLCVENTFQSVFSRSLSSLSDKSLLKLIKTFSNATKFLSDEILRSKHKKSQIWKQDYTEF